MTLPVLGVLVLGACGAQTGLDSPEAPTPSVSETTTSATADERTGPLAVGGPAECVEVYSPAAVASRDFAFDGIVIDVGAGGTDRAGEGKLNDLGVTFSIETWFVGDAGETITIDMAAPSPGTARSKAPDPYEPGMRLLVSGESRWGEGFQNDGIAWECGFSRYYDRATADAWSDALL